MTIRLAISVEGATEVRFVKDLLAPHLANFNVDVTPIAITTSTAANGKKRSGGGVNFDRCVHNLRILLATHSASSNGHVTSLYDFYGFGGRGVSETVEALEKRLFLALGSPPNLHCYVQLHEFEGLLLSNAGITAQYFGSEKLVEIVSQAVARAGSPEQVNDGAKTAPSKRLEKWTREHCQNGLLYTNRTKTLHGPLLAVRQTLAGIRSVCPRFNNWLTKLETLAGS